MELWNCTQANTNNFHSCSSQTTPGKQLHSFWCCKVPSHPWVLWCLPLKNWRWAAEGIKNQHFYQAPQLICLFANLSLRTVTYSEGNLDLMSQQKLIKQYPGVWTTDTCLPKDRLHALILLKSQMVCEIKVAIFNLFQVKRAKFLISCFAAQICPDRVSIFFKALSKE